MEEETSVTIAPVHGAFASCSTTEGAPLALPCSAVHQVALEPETGEPQPDVVPECERLRDCTAQVADVELGGSTTPSQEDVSDDECSVNVEQQCASCMDTLLPKTTEEACTQTLPDQCPPYYVDILSPADATAFSVVREDGISSDSRCATPQLVRSALYVAGNGGTGSAQHQQHQQLQLEGSPCITPGQCTPLLEHKTEHFSSSSLGLLPPVVICGGLGSAGARLPNSAEKSETSSAVLPICRICHMPGEFEDEQEMLISPCRCAGTLQFIHNTCLRKWLEISSKKSRKPPKCELCHYQYHRHKKFKFSHWRFPRVSRQDKILHLIFIVNLVIMIACAVATVMCFLSDKGQITKFPRNKVDLTTEEIITLSCGVLFFVSFFIAMSVQIKAKHTIYQLFVKFIMQNMEWEIDEYDKSKDTMFTTKTSKPAFV